MIEMVVVFAPPEPPTGVGAVVKISVETPGPGLAPRFVPLKMTVAPTPAVAVKVKLANVIAVEPPAPGMTLTVLKPLFIVRAPAVSDEAKMGFPIRLKLPAVNARARVSPIRSPMTVALLSSVNVPPVRIEIVVPVAVPEPLNIRVPALIVVVPL